MSCAARMCALFETIAPEQQAAPPGVGAAAGVDAFDTRVDAVFGALAGPAPLAAASPSLAKNKRPAAVAYVPPSRRSDDGSSQQPGQQRQQQTARSIGAPDRSQHAQRRRGVGGQSGGRGGQRPRGGGRRDAGGESTARSSEQVPGYLRNRQAYQRYSLEDVDTSEANNKTAAYSFLNALGSGGG